MTRCGRIELIYGPMFAGKTTELLRRLTEAQAAGRRVVAIQPAGDTRSGRGWLRTHADQAGPATPLEDADALQAAAGDAEVVGIDEAHFFDARLAEACGALAERGVRIIAAGVDWDHRGRLFPAIAALQAEADERVLLTAKCARCGGVATHTQRLVAGDAAIVVGGAEAYEPRCRTCFAPPD